MSVQSIIEFDGIDYLVKNPTIHIWAQLNLFKDIEEEDDYNVSLISLTTGIPEDKIRQAKHKEVKKAANYLADYFIKNAEGFHTQFEFEGVKYKFVNLNNLTFGEFVDLDEFLKKDISYRKGNMEQMMAILYRPVDENGEIEKYNSETAQTRAHKFKNLEVKYLTGTLRFFFLLRKELAVPTPYYLKMWIKMKRLKHLRGIGVGMERSFSWLSKTYQKLMK